MEEPEIDPYKIFDCPHCKLPAEVTHLLAIQQGGKRKYMYIAECLGEEEFMLSEEELADLS